MPGFPFIQKKSMKFMSAKPPNRMLVVSPTRVAAPWRLEETEMAMSSGTGEILSFLAIARPTGATIRRVATLSTKALTTPANTLSAVTAQSTFGTLTIIISASRAGMRLSIKRVTMHIVEEIISSTL